MRTWVLLLLAFAASACERAASPDASYDLAAQGLYAGAISGRRELALIGSLNHGASLWRTGDNERLYNWSHQPGEYAELVAAAFSPDGSVAVTTDPRTLVLWDTATGQSKNFWTTPGAVLDVAMLADNRRLLIGLDDHSAILFDGENGDYANTLLHEGEVGSVAVTDDGNRALTGSDDFTAVLWSLPAGEALHTYRHGSTVRAVALSPSGKYAFTAAKGDLVAIWDNETGKQLHQLHNELNHGARVAAFSDDERLLAVGYSNRRVALYDVASGQRRKLWDPGTRHALRATGAAILRVAFTNRTLLALTGDGRLLEFRLG